MAGFLTTRGSLILANGYNIVPILPGQKFPDIDDWLTEKTTEARLQGWKTNGRADYGIGITTGEISFVDVDILDPETAKEYRERFTLRVGFAPCRIGKYPKHGYLFRSEKPFKKITSRDYRDPNGERCRCECLGEGQQFVARAIHPDTGKPYKWIDGESPDNTPVDKLPVLTEKYRQIAIDIFHELMEEKGWPLYRRTDAPKTGLPATIDSDDPFDDIYGNEQLGLTIDELRDKVRLIPNDDADYEGQGLTWFNLMAAVHMETAGSEEGKEIALEWSERSSKHEGARFEKTWRSLSDGTLRARRNITAKLIIKLAKPYEKAAHKEQVAELIRRMDFAKDSDELAEIAADCAKLEVDLMERSRFINALQKSYKAITNSNLSIKEARDLVRYKPDGTTPDWLENWVYLNDSDRFFNVVSKESLVGVAFDRTFSRNLPPDTMFTASQYALARIQIPVYRKAIYMPNEGDTFDLNGESCVNLYTDRLVPAVPAKLSGGDKLAVAIVEQHLRNICPSERDFEILVSWLRYVALHRDHPNWAVVIQGPGGDGKTFIAMLMNAIIGANNTYQLSASTLESNFNAWSHGHLLVCIEEIMVAGQKYTIFARMKPLVSNAIIEVHPKGHDPYDVPNTQAYLLFSNHRDALPVDDTDRRYFVIMSRWRDAEALAEFMADKPAYFDDLQKAIERHAGALRGWLESCRQHSEFSPKGRAPFSHGRAQMAALNRSDEAEIFADLLKTEQRPDVCRKLVLVSALIEELYGEVGPVQNYGSKLRKLLSENGFDYLGRVRINGERESVWSKTPDVWTKHQGRMNRVIEKWLKEDL